MLGRKEAQCRRPIFSLPTSRNEHSGQIEAPKWQNTGGDERQKEAPQRGSAENRPFAKRVKRHRQPVSMPHKRLAKCSFLTRECPFFAPKTPESTVFCLPEGTERNHRQGTKGIHTNHYTPDYLHITSISKEEKDLRFHGFHGFHKCVFLCAYYIYIIVRVIEF